MERIAQEITRNCSHYNGSDIGYKLLRFFFGRSIICSANCYRDQREACGEGSRAITHIKKSPLGERVEVDYFGRGSSHSISDTLSPKTRDDMIKKIVGDALPSEFRIKKEEASNV